MMKKIIIITILFISLKGVSQDTNKINKVKDFFGEEYYKKRIGIIDRKVKLWSAMVDQSYKLSNSSRTGDVIYELEYLTTKKGNSIYLKDEITNLKNGDFNGLNFEPYFRNKNNISIKIINTNYYININSLSKVSKNIR